jgi:hypothetical protein
MRKRAWKRREVDEERVALAEDPAAMVAGRPEGRTVKNIKSKNHQRHRAACCPPAHVSLARPGTCASKTVSEPSGVPLWSMIRISFSRASRFPGPARISISISISISLSLSLYPCVALTFECTCLQLFGCRNYCPRFEDSPDGKMLRRFPTWINEEGMRMFEAAVAMMNPEHPVYKQKGVGKKSGSAYGAF